MAGPWEQYQRSDSGPWSSYGGPAPAPEPTYDPTEGMSTFDRVAAGGGKAIVDTLRGAGQWLGLTDRQDVEEARRRDAALMRTTAGQVGNFGANVAMLAPASLIPGAATIPGAAALGGVVGALQPSTSTRETLTNIGVGGAGGAGGQAIANGIGALVRNRAANATQALASEPQKVAAAQSAAQAGYVIPPADLPNSGPMTELLSGLSGKIKTGQVASQRNQGVTDSLARKAVGLQATDDLTADVLQNLRNQVATQGYAPVRGAGTVQADAAFLKGLDNIASTYQGASKSFPGLANNEVDDLVTALRQPSFDAGSAVDAVKVLRERADKAYRAGDAGLGKAAKQAAGELESVLERHLTAAGNPDAVKAFRDARQTIAKTYSVQKALNSETGNVSAPKLAAELAKGRPLTGELRTIAQTGSSFPRATQMLKEAPKSLSPLDFAVGAMTAGSTGNPLSLATLGARPIARGMLLSGPMQRAAIYPSAPTAGLLGSQQLGLLGAPVGATTGLLSYGGQ